MFPNSNNLTSEQQLQQLLNESVGSYEESLERYRILEAVSNNQNNTIASMIQTIKDLQTENEVLKQVIEAIIKRKYVPSPSESMSSNSSSCTADSSSNKGQSSSNMQLEHEKMSKSMLQNTNSLWFQREKHSKDDGNDYNRSIQFINHDTGEIRSWIEGYHASKFKKKRKYTKRQFNSL
jgi:hypothetical protein